MKKTLAMLLLGLSLILLLCACGGIRQGARDPQTAEPTSTPVTLETPATSGGTEAPASAQPTTGTETKDVDALLKELDSITSGDDYEDITLEEPGTGDVQNQAQDILSDLEKNFDMPVN